MSRPVNNPWLNRFAVLTAAATFILIGIGGLVTSNGVGMAVPDWPTTYGYNMFLFPVSQWVGGIFYEHTHRLVATIVGTLVVCLTRWLGGAPSRKPLAIIGTLEALVGIALPFLDPKLRGAGYFLTGIGCVVLFAALDMFLFPISKWVGGIFYKHTHRLVAKIVGARVVALTRWLSGLPARKSLAIIGTLAILVGAVVSHFDEKLKGAGLFLSGVGGVVLLAAVVWARDEPAERPLRVLGWLAFFLVQLQGLLGGLRVILYWDGIGIFHAGLAQAFLVLLCAIALFTTSWWQNLQANIPLQTDRLHLRPVFVAVTALIFAQLVIGATMRHAHAGLSIPDFPLAYHKLWPPMDAASVASYNENRVQVSETNPITAFQIALQMAHRLMALLIVCAVTFCAAWTRRLGSRHPLARWSLFWLALILCQIVLGAATIWSNKAADIATLHVLVGALSLVTSALLTLATFRVLIPARAAVPAAAQSAQTSFASAKPVVSAPGH